MLVLRSPARRAFDRAFKNGPVLVSAETIEELNDVLRRPKFKNYVTEEERMEFLTTYLREATLVEVHQLVKVCRDPRDDAFLALALSGRATHLVSGDADLLSLHPFRGISVLSPAGFIRAGG